MIPRKLHLQIPRPLWAGGAVAWRTLISAGTQDAEDSPAVWDLAEWDNAVWGGGGPGSATWTDISTYTLGVTTTRGKDRFEDAFRTSTFTLTLDNQTGIFNPIVGAAEFMPQLRPGRWFRLESNVGAGWVPQFTGYIDAIDDVYGGGGFEVNAVVQGYGFEGTFALNQLPPLDVAIPAGQLTSDRVAQLLDRMGWDPDFRDLQTGVASMTESTIPGSALVEIQKAVTAEGGGFFTGKTAVPTFKARDWLVNDPRSTELQLRVGGPASDVDPLGWTPDWSAQRIFNDVQLSGVDGVEQRVFDTASWAAYLRRTFKRGNIENDSHTSILELADRFLGAFAWDRLRVESVEVWPKDGVSGAKVLDLELGDLVEANVATGAGWGYTAEAHVMRISHVLTADDWRCTLRLDDALRTPPTDGAFDDGFADGFQTGED